MVEVCGLVHMEVILWDSLQKAIPMPKLGYFVIVQQIQYIDVKLLMDQKYLNQQDMLDLLKRDKGVS